MPANLTPQYLKADKWYRSATTNEEKILALEEMLRVIPKHKGTEHMQADLKQKLSKLKEAPSKKAGSKVDIFHIPPSGAGQVALLGTPNCGKSSIVAAITKAHVEVADFPFSTTVPVPGMAMFEDVQIEVVDMPPITADYAAPGQVGTYRNCHLIGIVIDLSADIEEQMGICLDFLESKNLLADPKAEIEPGSHPGKKVIIICTKCDIAKPSAVDIVKKSCKYDLELVEISTVTAQGFDLLTAAFFKQLNIIRVYTKKPGQKADTGSPFTLPKNSTVMDLAEMIHRELAEKIKFARIWGTGVYDGQNVQKTHVLNDKDIIELHFA